MLPRRIVVGANAHKDITAKLRALRPDLELRGNVYTAVTPEDLQWADTYVGFKRPPLASMENVEWVHCTGAGVDGWLYPDELSRDIALTRTSESFGPSIAEWVVSRALAISQELFPLRDAQQAHRWEPRNPGTLRGARVLVVGTGDIGSHVAQLFLAFGCVVTGVSRSGQGNKALFPTLAAVDELPALVESAEWIVLTVPLTKQTHHLVDHALLSRCRNAVLINVGRGAVMQEDALPTALERGWIRAAALDVFEVEPLPAASPLWGDARVIVSPHISGLTRTDAAVEGFLKCLTAFEAGESSPWLVNRERGY